MDKTQRIIVILLIIAILFSVMSLIISLTANNIRFFKYSSSQRDSMANKGNVQLIVESDLKPSGGTNG